MVLFYLIYVASRPGLRYNHTQMMLRGRIPINNTSGNNPRFSTRGLALGGMVAAIYVVLTLIFQPISFGAIQFRVAEVMTLTPILSSYAPAGLFVGCLLANWLGGGIWFDVALGSVATLLAAICTRKFREKPPVAAIFPTLFNGLIVGPVVYFAYVRAPGDPVSVPTLLFNMATVALGELAVCYALGLPMIYGLKKLPSKLFE